MSARNPAGRMARWQVLLQEFDMTIHHRAGKDMPMVDPLSRAPAPLRPGELSVTQEVERQLDGAAPAVGVILGADGTPWQPSIRFDDSTEGDERKDGFLTTTTGNVEQVLAVVGVASRNDIPRLQQADPILAKAISDVKEQRGQASLFQLQDGVLYRRRNNTARVPARQELALAVPKSMRSAAARTTRSTIGRPPWFRQDVRTADGALLVARHVQGRR